jgi:tetratricopeptide (TPR) repeat protein
MRARGLAAVVLAAVLGAGACATSHPAPPVVAGAPHFPSYPTPEIPASAEASPDVTRQHLTAWQRLQAGDIRGATRDFSGIVKKSPRFYPSLAGLGFALLASGDEKGAAARFTAATALNDQYLPAWMGLAEAQLALKHDGEAIAAMEHVLAIDPARSEVASRLALVRFRQVQALIEQGRRARLAGNLPEARRILGNALALSPQSTAILHELVLAETAAGALDEAESHARAILQVAPDDADAYATLGDVLERRGDDRAAAQAFTRAAAIDPSGNWRARAEALRVKANLAALPASFANLENAPTVTRAEVAAFVGIKLEPVIDRAPKRPAGVITDIRNHWAETWVLPMTQAGVMEVYSNHTFQPDSVVRRADLARVAARLVELAAAGRPALTSWRAARPRIADVPAGNLFYRSVALATAAGVMRTNEDGRFEPTRPATGAELSAVVARIGQLTR